MASFGLALAIAVAAAPVHAQTGVPLIDNQRVVVWKNILTPGTPGVMRKHDHDFVLLVLAGGTIRITDSSGKTSVAVRKFGDAIFGRRGTEEKEELISGGPAQIVEVDLKDYAGLPIVNNSGYPNGFPRPGAKNMLDNDRVSAWTFTWKLGQATPMHYHSADIVGVFRYKGQVKSTPPNGEATVVNYAAGEVRYTKGHRIHSEILMSGRESAILLELK